MTKQESLIQIATRHQVFLERRKSGVFNEIVPSIEELQSRILTTLRELNVDTLDELNKRQFASFIREISAIQQETYANVQSDLLDSADELALSEADFERRTLVLATDSNIALPVRKALLRQIRQRPITATGDLLEPFIKNWSDSQTRKVNGIMRRGFSEGWTNQQMVAAIRGTRRLNFSDGVMKIITRQANTVVRTAIQHSASTARLHLWEENKDVVKKYEWVSTLDSSTTTICFIEETKVASFGDISDVFKRKYTGDLITIRTSSGKQITGTPNHPILTSNGWTSLAELNPFDQVVYTINTKCGSISRNSEISMPSKFGELFNALCEMPSSTVRSEGTTASDFHGDGCTGDGNIHIVNTKSSLRHAFKPSKFKLVKNVLLSIVKLPISLFCDCLFKLRLCARGIIDKSSMRNSKGVDCGKDSRFRSSGLLTNFFNTRTTSVEICYFFNVMFRNLVTLSSTEVLESGMAFKKACRGGNSGFILSSDDVSTHSAFVVAEYIVEKLVKNAGSFDCHVYNLQCSQGIYMAGGIIVKNCRSLDAQQYELGKGPVPPIHNGCRSTTIAVLSSKFYFLDEGATRSSAVGPVSSELTYYDWLKKQPVAFQNAAIGKKRATLLRKGGLSADKFAKLNLNRNFEPLTLEEMKRIEPLAFQEAGL